MGKVAIVVAGGTIDHPRTPPPLSAMMLGDGATEVFVLTLGWGCGVIAMVCHTAYCGVFTRWYFAQPGAPSLSPCFLAHNFSLESWSPARELSLEEPARGFDHFLWCRVCKKTRNPPFASCGVAGSFEMRAVFLATLHLQG